MRWAREQEFDRDIRTAHRAFPSVPIPVIKAIIGQESAYDPSAYREEPQIGDASRGLMQLLSRTAREEGYGGTLGNLFIPAINIYYGTKHLAGLMARLGNWTDVWSAYNGGIRPELGFGAKVTQRGVRCMGREVPIGQYCNQTYVDRVQRNLRYFANDQATGTPPSRRRAPEGGRDVSTKRGGKTLTGLALLALAGTAFLATR